MLIRKVKCLKGLEYIIKVHSVQWVFIQTGDGLKGKTAYSVLVSVGRLQATRTASVPLGMYCTSLRKCTTGINTILPKDIASISVLGRALANTLLQNLTYSTVQKSYAHSEKCCRAKMP